MKERPKFYVFYKDFNDGKIKKYDVLDSIFDDIFNKKGQIRKSQFYIFGEKSGIIPVRTKDNLQEYIDGQLMYHYWSKCEWEMIACDWPYRDDGLIDSARPIKLDTYEHQLKPNLPVITDLVWNYIEPKIKKLIEKEK